MRRLPRWTFNTLAAASLLLCLATAGLWVRGYWVADMFTAQRPEASAKPRMWRIQHYLCYLGSYRGEFAVWLGWSRAPEVGPTPSWQFEMGHPNDLLAAIWPNQRFYSQRQDYDGHAYYSQTWSLPAWSLVSAFAVLPAVVTFRQLRAVRRRRQRSRMGLCPACGYDLRASPGRCPECGRGQGREVRSQKSEVSEAVLDPHPSDLRPPTSSL